MTPLSPTLEWYALHTRSRHEKMVELSLAQKDFTVFLPTVEVKSRRRDRRKLYQKPLFPGYLFVETLLLPEHHAAIRRTPGVASILGREGGPTPVPRDQVESLRVLVGSGTDLDPYEYLKEGQYVEVVAGPLKGATGILVEKQRKKQRLIVSLDIMNQAVSASLDACEVEPYRKS
jgi:transcription antitermination factor NusG